jgi:hypothetical protein
MTDLPPRNPALGALRLFALGWAVLSLLGIVAGVLAVLYGGAWGCQDHAQGWFACTAATFMIPLSAAGSLFTALVVLLFAHLFYVAGARVRTVEPKRRSLRDKVGEAALDGAIDVVEDLLD